MTKDEVFAELYALRKRNAFLEKENARLNQEVTKYAYLWVNAQELASRRQVLCLLGVSPLDAANGQPSDR